MIQKIKDWFNRLGKVVSAEVKDGTLQVKLDNYFDNLSEEDYDKISDRVDKELENETPIIRDVFEPKEEINDMSYDFVLPYEPKPLKTFSRKGKKRSTKFEYDIPVPPQSELDYMKVMGTKRMSKEQLLMRAELREMREIQNMVDRINGMHDGDNT